MCKTIVFANQKGGVGKSTTATAVTGVLSSKGKKVLFVDTDATASSTDFFKLSNTRGIATLYDVILASNKISAKEAIHHTDRGDIIPADDLLADANSVLACSPTGMYRLDDALADLKKDYDYIILDTGPRLDLLLLNALICADFVVIPVVPDHFSMKGLVGLNETIKQIQSRQNPTLTIAGILITKFHGNARLDRTAQQEVSEASHYLNTRVFNTTIRESVKQREAQACFTYITDYAPTSTTAKDYFAFVEELQSIVE